MLSFPWNTIILNGLRILFSFQMKFVSHRIFFDFSDQIITASFDKTAKLWNTSNGACLQTYFGHRAEVVATEFSPLACERLATASMDRTAKIFQIETGQVLHTFHEHNAEVIVAHFHKNGNVLLTGSFDGNAYLWDLRANE